MPAVSFASLLKGQCEGGRSTSYFLASATMFSGRLIFDDGQLTSLFRRALEVGPMDYYQNSLAWQCYQRTLPVRDKLFRYRRSDTRTCPRRGQSNETVLPTIVMSFDFESMGLRRTSAVAFERIIVVNCVHHQDCPTSNP